LFNLCCLFTNTPMLSKLWTEVTLIC
jgi:hypothetical protein